MKRFVILISMLFCALVLRAQSNILKELETATEGTGVVRINQPERLEKLLEFGFNSDKKKQVMGYRIMVYSGNNSRKAREEANRMAEYMRENFPGAEVYVQFQSPFRVCLYGDYRTRKEAEEVMARMKATKKFKEISVRRGLINLHNYRKPDEQQGEKTED